MLTNTAPAPDKRNLERHSLVYFVPLYDQKTGNLRAHIVDVNLRGFLATSETPFLSGSLHRFRMESDMDLELADEVDFNAICLWCKKDGEEDVYDAGFKFINLSVQARMAITSYG
ncbi:MAG: PilZ domain-containing protein [Gammaproteobacteria bacterium]|nr:PilZ domain-containing protein [Gammaproteobacteria bacterium]